MTSEVALLNRSAVALAADSAATVSHWEKDHYETFYFKGTNKIFQLSATHPVGIMIYAAASLQGAPWDVLIKSYRDNLGNKPHDQLQQYALDLFDYIASNVHIFSPGIQEKQFKYDVDIVAARITVAVDVEDSYKNAPDVATKSATMRAVLADTRTKITAAEFVGNANQADVDTALAKYTAVIKDMFENDAYYSKYKDIIDFEELAKLAIMGQYKTQFTNLSSSGIVVTGFGDKDYFPRLVAYRCYGLVLGKFIIEEEPDKAQTISQTNGSAFVSFAQDDMIRTFVYGTGASALVELDKQFNKAIGDFHGALLKAGLAQDVTGDPAKMTELDKLRTEANQQFADAFVRYSVQSHSRPMRRILSALPFDELAELAETLVLLESLKERVTSPSASVSGPIDVAVISKNDGFIWIKRKHYFDPKLNSRYFSKRGLTGVSP